MEEKTISQLKENIDGWEEIQDIIGCFEDAVVVVKSDNGFRFYKETEGKFYLCGYQIVENDSFNKSLMGDEK